MFERAVASIVAVAPRLGVRRAGAVSSPRVAYTAFVSYSHAADGKLAPALQLALHRFARPWYRLRALRIFRDQASLSATPALWSSIVAALDGAEFFLLLASPEAAASEWVDREVAHWCEQRSRANLLVVLTGGELVWDEPTDDFDWARTTAMPPAARGKFAEEPRWIDLRFARGSDDLSLQNGRFRDVIADLAAPLHGRPKDELIGEDVRQHRRTIFVATTAAIFLSVLALAASAGAVIAWKERGSAIQHAQVARSRELAARTVAQLGVRTPEFDRGPATALNLALAAVGATPSPTAEAASVLRRALAVPHVRFGIHASTRDVGLAFTRDGSELITASANGRVTWWNVRTGGKTRTVTGPRVPGGTVALSADGIRLVTAAPHGRSTLWNTTNGTIVAELPGSASSAPFGERGRLVATTLRGRTRLFDATTGKPGGTIGSGLDASIALFDPAGTRLALVGADADASEVVGIWNVASRAGLHVLYRDSAHPELTLATFSPNGRRLAVASWDGNGAILAADGRSRPLPIGQSDEIRSVAFSPDSARVLTVSVDKQAIVWDAATGRWQDVLPLTGYGNDGAFSPDGRWIATAADDNVLAQLWDASTGIAAAGLGGAKPFVDAVVFSPDGRLVAVRDDTGRVLVWELEASGRELGSAPRTGGSIRLGAEAGTVTALPKNPRTLQTPLVWRANGVTVRSKLGTPTDAPSPNRAFLAFVPDDGQYLTVDVFDRETKHQRELRHDGEVESVAWRADSTLLATASNDGTARVWTPAGGQVSIERGHRGGVAGVAFDPAGELLVTAGADDGTARVWDVASGDELAVLGGGPGAKRLDAAAFSPDGRVVVTRAVDGSVAASSCGICGSLDELVAAARRRTRVVPFTAGN